MRHFGGIASQLPKVFSVASVLVALEIRVYVSSPHRNQAANEKSALSGNSG